MRTLTDCMLVSEGIEAGVVENLGAPAADLLADWRTGRADVLMALGDVPPGTRLEWRIPPG